MLGAKERLRKSLLAHQICLLGYPSQIGEGPLWQDTSVRAQKIGARQGIGHAELVGIQT